MFGRRIFIDIYISMFMALTLTFFALSERYPERRRLFLVLMYACVGLGVLTKGPVAAALPSANAFRRFVQSGAHDWATTEREFLATLVLPCVIAFGGAAIALFGKPAYKLVTREDGVAEWLHVNAGL